MDIYELIEHEKLMSFHVQTLKLYSALCFQANHKAQHTICRYCDERQLLYAIKSEQMPGQLRMAFFDTLNALHLESYAQTVDITRNEFIVPMGAGLRGLYKGNIEMGNSMKSLQYMSIRPKMNTSPISPDAYNVKDLSLPAFPLDVVREVVIEALDMAADVNQVHNRDPIGGSNEDLFVPLIKILDKLLLCGALGNEDIEHLLVLIHPATWDRTFERIGKDQHRKGILNMKIHEGVKLELCHLLHHLCDVQLRHRIEYTVAFCQDYMGELQVDQLRRYVEIKQSDMPSAVAAKKTKEFRCDLSIPIPKKIMNRILHNLPAIFTCGEATQVNG